MASPGSGHFFIMASGKSGISDVNGLKGIEIGVSQGTIIDYVTNRLLEKAGFSRDDIKTISVPKIPDRMALLASGGLKAAVMPDPLAALAVQQGAKIILDDTSNPELGASVISFRKEVIDAHPDSIKAFLAAIEEAVTLINADPAKYSSLLAEKKIVPQPLIGKYVTPKFPAKGIPSEAEWKDVLAWARDKGLLSADVSYKDSVTPAFLP
jgi:NitT/TauT family transport system substrate-binding protein